MNDCRVHAAAIPAFAAGHGSANDDFKAQYQRNLRAAGVAAVLISGVLIALSPRYVPQPYRLREAPLQLTDIEVEVIIEDPPEVAAAPVLTPEVEAAAEEDPRAVDTIELPGFDRYYQPGVSQSAPYDDGFVASSTTPQLVSRPKPHYPEVARMAQIEGVVVVKVLVGIDGTVTEAQVVQGAHPLLDNAALKAARKCLFLPGRQREMKVPTWVAVPYNFRLR